LAAQAGTELWRRGSEEKRKHQVEPAALSIEEYLRTELRDSEHPHLRAQYWAVPLYLQELLQVSSERFATDADNFERLLNQVLKLPRVVFVTLNYDTIFDRVLERSHHPLNSLDAYIGDRQAPLIKLHGSVNWGRSLDISDIENPSAWGFRATCWALAESSERLGSEIQYVNDSTIPADATRHANGEWYYPALAAPLGPDDETTCPPEHLSALRGFLDRATTANRLHILVLGYSCLDRAPLALLRESENSIVSAAFVNGTRAAGVDALERMQVALGPPAPVEGRDSVEIFDGGFTEYVASDSLRRFVEHVASF
jgi:hypothetical protein